MAVALVAVNFGLLVFGAVQIAPIAGTGPVVAFAFLVGTLTLGLGMKHIESFGDGNAGADE